MKPVMDYFKHPTSKTTNQVCAQPLYICQYQGVGCWIVVVLLLVEYLL